MKFLIFIVFALLFGLGLNFCWGFDKYQSFLAAIILSDILIKLEIDKK